MLLPPRRQHWRTVCLGAALALFLVFAALAALVHFRDRTYSDAARLRELQNATLAEPTATTTDWPQWRGPGRDGVSADKGLLARWPAELLTARKLWEKQVGDGFASVAVAGGRAYTLMQDGGAEVVVCWDAADGRELWRFRYPGQYVNGMGSGPRATPTVAGDVVYTVGATGVMHCLKTHPASAGGEVVWTKDLLKDFGAANLRWGVSFSPLVEGELVYVNPGGPDGNSVAALDRHTGATVWRTLNDPAGYSSPVAATLAGKRQIVFFTGAAVLGVAPADGTLYWRFPWPTDNGVNAATPIVVGDYVLIASGYGQGCALLHIEPAGDGLQAGLVYRYPRQMRSQFDSPVLYQGHVYGFDDSLLTCMELRTGKVCWKQRGFDKGSLLVADGRLIILGEFGKLALVEATPAGYHELSRVEFSSAKCWTMPTLADGRLYLRDPQRVVCLDLRAKQ